jgi:hypothetical protein
MIKLSDFYDIGKYLSSESTRNPFISGFVVAFSVVSVICSVAYCLGVVSFIPHDVRKMENDISEQGATIEQQKYEYSEAVRINEELLHRLNDSKIQCSDSVNKFDQLNMTLSLEVAKESKASSDLDRCVKNLDIKNEIGVYECDKNWDFSVTELKEFMLFDSNHTWFAFGGNSIRLQFNYDKAKMLGALSVDDNSKHIDFPMRIGHDYCILSPSSRTKIRLEDITNENGYYRGYFSASLLRNIYRQ